MYETVKKLIIHAENAEASLLSTHLEQQYISKVISNSFNLSVLAGDLLLSFWYRCIRVRRDRRDKI